MLLGSLVESKSILKYQYNLKKQILKLSEEKQLVKMHDFLSQYQSEITKENDNGNLILANGENKTTLAANNTNASNSNMNNTKTRERKSLTNYSSLESVSMGSYVPIMAPDSPRKSNGLNNKQLVKQASRTNLVKSFSSPKPTTSDLVIAATKNKSTSIQQANKKSIKEKEVEVNEPNNISPKSTQANDTSPKHVRDNSFKHPTPSSTPPSRPSPAVSPSLDDGPVKFLKNKASKPPPPPAPTLTKSAKLPMTSLKAKSSNELNFNSLAPSPQPSKVTLEDFFKKVPISNSQNNQHKRNSTDSTASSENVISIKSQSTKIKDQQQLSIDVSQPRKAATEKPAKTKQLIQNKLNRTVDAVIESTIKLVSNQKLNSPIQKSPSSGIYQNGELNLANNDLVKFLLLNKSNQDYSFLFQNQNETFKSKSNGSQAISTNGAKNLATTSNTEEFEINRLNSQLRELQNQKQQQFKRLNYLHDDLNQMSRPFDQNDILVSENMSPTSSGQSHELIYALNILNQSDKTEECKLLNFAHLLTFNFFNMLDSYET